MVRGRCAKSHITNDFSQLLQSILVITSLLQWLGKLFDTSQILSSNRNQEGISTTMTYEIWLPIGTYTQEFQIQTLRDNGNGKTIMILRPTHINSGGHVPCFWEENGLEGFVTGAGSVWSAAGLASWLFWEDFCSLQSTEMFSFALSDSPLTWPRLNRIEPAKNRSY